MASCEYVTLGRPQPHFLRHAQFAPFIQSCFIGSTSHRHHPELSDRRLSYAQPPFGPLQKRSPATTHLGIIYRAVTHDRTNCGQALKVVARLSPPSAVPLLKWYARGTAADRGGHRSGRGVMPRYFDHLPTTKTKRPPNRPTVLSLTVRVDALDFALAV
jgi:hypothetical protein